MVDRNARNRAIDALVSFRSGALTNDEINRKWPQASSDTGLTEIGVVLGGSFFIGIRTYRLTDEGHGSDEALSLVDRCIVFLRTDRQVGKPIRPLRGSVTRYAIAGTVGLPLAWWYAWGLDVIWMSFVAVAVGWIVLLPIVKRELGDFREAKRRYDNDFETWLAQRKSVEEDADPDWWPFHGRMDYERACKHVSR